MVKYKYCLFFDEKWTVTNFCCIFSLPWAGSKGTGKTLFFTKQQEAASKPGLTTKDKGFSSRRFSGLATKLRFGRRQLNFPLHQPPFTSPCLNSPRHLLALLASCIHKCEFSVLCVPSKGIQMGFRAPKHLHACVRLGCTARNLLLAAGVSGRCTQLSFFF